MKTEFVFVASRGALKIYSLDAPSAAHLRPVEEIVIEAGKGRYSEDYADQAGGFPNGGTAGNGNSISERHAVEQEYARRCIRQIAEKVTQVASANRHANWSLVAPPELSAAILEDVPGDLRNSIRRSVEKDLVNASESDILEHLRAA